MDEVVDAYELSPLQQGMLFHAVSAPGSGVDIQQVVVTLDESVDVALLERALCDVMQRHPVLRTRFRWVDVEEPRQEVLARAGIVATVADWGDLGLEDAERRFDAVVRADRRRDFDLSCAPMMRLFVARFPGGRSRVLWTFHHALLDGRSHIVLQEWFGLYDAARGGETLVLAPARPYRDYIEWRRSLDLVAAEAFWRTTLGSFDAPTPFGVDALRSGASGEPFDACERRLPREVSGQVRIAADRAQVTVNTMMQAAWAVLLHRYSGESDIVFGATRAGRVTGVPDVDTIAGLFINTLPMRVEVDADAEIVPWLHSLRAQHIALRPYEHTPLAAVQSWSGIAPGTTLFESVVVYDHQSLDTRLQMPGRHFEYTGQTNFPLALMAYGDDEMLLRLEYATQRFSDSVITRMLEHLANLLTRLADPDTTHLRDLDPVSPAERAALVGDGPIPTLSTRDATLHAGFARQAMATPQAIALSAQTTTGRVELSYAELDERAETLANHLRTLGVSANHVVGLRLERSPEVVIGILAILKAGAAYLPLDPLYPTERVAFMLEDAEVHVVLAQRAFADELAPLPVTCICLDEPLPPTTTTPPPAVEGRGEDLAYVMYTSGSTGLPKGVRVTHHNVLRLFAATVPLFGFGPTDVWTLWHSYAFDISVSELWGALLTGGRLVVVPHDTSRDPATFRALVEREHVTVLSQTPTGFQAFIDTDHTAPPADFTLRYILLCGEALHLQTLQPWFDRYGDDTPQIINMYGPTETTLYVTHQHITQADLSADAGSIIGIPFCDTRIYLLDTHGQPVPTGVAGELHIAGDCVAAGYLKRPDLTAQRFLTDPFHGGPMYRSGDLARRHQNGELEYLGRIDQQVKIRGFRIELGEIETAIAQHPNVRQVAVIDHEDTPGDKKLIAYLVTTDTPPPTLITDLRDTLRTHLPEYMIPTHFHHLDTLPLTTSGKLDRKALPTPQHQRTQATNPYIAPQNPAEEILAGIYARVLGLERVGVDDSFFELGGDSLLAMRVIAAANIGLDAGLAVRAVFEAPTVAQLAARIGEGSGGLPPLVAGQRPAVVPMSFAQSRLWLLDQFQGPSPVYNMPAAFRISGALDVEALGAALADVVGRHESLRTLFAAPEGIPRQLVVSAERADFGWDIVDATGWSASRLDEAIGTAARHSFDLAAEIPLRATLFRLADDEHVLVAVVHHIAADGWSVNPLMRDLGVAYASRCAGRAPGWVPLPVQYVDYTLWQRAQLGDLDDSDSRIAAQLAHWEQALAGLPERLQLPTDRPYPAVADYRGASVVVDWPAGLQQQVARVAREYNASSFMVVQAALAVLLAKISASPEVAVGFPIAGRGDPALDELVGVFINTLVLRVDAAGDPTVAELLGQVRQRSLAAYEHQDVPFEVLIDRLSPTRSLTHHPLVQVMLAWQNFTGQDNNPAAGLVLGDVEVTPLPVDTHVARMDLSFFLAERWSESGEPAGISGTVEFRTDVFDTASIEMLIERLGRVVLAITADPTRRLSSVDVLDAAERAALVGDGPIPTLSTRDATLHAGFARQAMATPQAIALSAQTTTGRVELSYAELDERAETLANHLRTLGVSANHVVGLRLERSPEVVIGILAILKAGAAYLPLDPLYPTERVAFMLEDAEVHVVLAQRAFADELAPLPVTCICLDEPLPPTTTTPPPAVEGRGEDLAYVMYTSGSTGLPKGVRVTHHNVLRLFAATVPLFGFGPTDVWTLWHSYAFDISVSELWGALLTGGRLVVVPHDTSRDPATFRALVEREHVTVLSQTPTGFQAFIDTDHTAPPADFTLRYILLCGEALHLQTLQPWFDRYGDDTPQIINMYGPTETTLYVTHQHITQADLSADAGSIIGTPLPDIRIYLLDTHGQPVPTGVAGELHIAGAGVAAGYLKRPDLTAQRFLTDPFHGGPMYRSGDLARRHQNGELEYLGRIDQQVKIRGFRIELGEIETAIAQHPNVRQVAVIDHEDTPGDKKLIAYLVTTDTPPPTLITDLRDTLRTHLPEYMIPTHFHHLDTLPLTTSGKLDRKALPTPQHQRTQATNPYIAPQNPAEQTIADIWKTLLHIDKVGLDDHFFELGGHSLLLVRAHAQLTDRLRTDLPMVALLQYPTVRTLARHLTGHNNHNTTTTATMDRARKQHEAHARQRNLTGKH